MWQASAERILLAMTYGEFGAVVNTQDNSHVRDLLNHNVVLEMDGLSSNSDRTHVLGSPDARTCTAIDWPRARGAS